MIHLPNSWRANFIAPLFAAACHDGLEQGKLKVRLAPSASSSDKTVSIAAALNLNAKRSPKAPKTIRRPPDGAAPTAQKVPIMPPRHTPANNVG